MLIPIIALLVAFCGVLGFSVYSNVTTAMTDLFNKQLDASLELVEHRLVAAQESQTLRPESYQEIIDGLGVADGGVFVVSETGEVIADSRQLMLGQQLANQDWYAAATQYITSEFTAVYGQAEVYAHGVILNDMLVVSYISSQKMTDFFNTPLYVIGCVGLVCVGIVVILIYFLITRLFIIPVESLDEQLDELTDNIAEKSEYAKEFSSGEVPLDLTPLKRCPELSASVRQVNKLLMYYAERAISAESGALAGEASLAGDAGLAGLVSSAKKKSSALVDPEPAAEPTAAAKPALSASSAEPAPLPWLASSTQKTLSPAKEKATFAVVDVLREAVSVHRQTITSKHLRFSLLVDDHTPEIVYANRYEISGALSGFLGKVLSEAAPNSQVDAEVIPKPLPQSLHTQQPSTIAQQPAQQPLSQTHDTAQRPTQGTGLRDPGKESIAIVLKVHYNGRDERVSLHVKRG
jgi:hypothetical protein